MHDRDSIYSEGVDLALRTMGLRFLKTPVAVPQANADCERVIGTARRERLDWLIPLNEPRGSPGRQRPEQSEGSWLAALDDFRNWLIREAA